MRAENVLRLSFPFLAASSVFAEAVTTYPTGGDLTSTDYLEKAKDSLDVLQQWYNQTTGLWETCGWWNGANAMTVIADLAVENNDTFSQAQDVFANTFAKAPAYNPANAITKLSARGIVSTTYGTPSYSPKDIDMRHRRLRARDSFGGNSEGYVNSCYDDNGWWALAWIAAWDLTKEASYLATAQGIFQNMTMASPTSCGNGGITWCSTNTYVNAISNELYLSVAAHLATRVPENPEYLSTAQKQWAWFKASNLIGKNNTINDGLMGDCTNNNATVWSYNQGVILGALVELNTALNQAKTPDSSLLRSAETLASAGIATLADENHIIHDFCEPECFPDATQFKGIYIRNLLRLHKAQPRKEYAQVIMASANSIINVNENTQGQIDLIWSGVGLGRANASTHSSGMDALVAAVYLDLNDGDNQPAMTQI